MVLGGDSSIAFQAWRCSPACCMVLHVAGTPKHLRCCKVTHCCCRSLQVAVKVVQIGSATELLNFLREIEALANLRHPNIVPFCAAVLEVGGVWSCLVLLPGCQSAQSLACLNRAVCIAQYLQQHAAEPSGSPAHCLQLVMARLRCI